MPSKLKPQAPGSSSHRKHNANPIPKARTPSHRNDKRTIPPTVTAGTSGSKSPHHLVLDLLLPSHVISDRSLFTTYTSSRKLHRTVFGNDITIEGYGDVHVRTFAGTTSILFRLRDCWHVPSSSHHFLSCTRVISQGKQVMLAGRTPRMIYSHRDRLAEPRLPKYVPFALDGSNFVLKFENSAQETFPSQPCLTAIQIPTHLFACVHILSQALCQSCFQSKVQVS